MFRINFMSTSVANFAIYMLTYWAGITKGPDVLVAASMRSPNGYYIGYWAGVIFGCMIVGLLSGGIASLLWQRKLERDTLREVVEAKRTFA